MRIAFSARFQPPEAPANPGIARRALRYAAFISYSHGGDADLAASIQSSLQQLARPWDKTRALAFFATKRAFPRIRLCGSRLLPRCGSRSTSSCSPARKRPNRPG